MLRFGRCEFTEVGVRHLARLTHLRVLDLPNVNLADNGLAILANFPELEELNLPGTQFTPTKRLNTSRNCR